MQKLFRCVVLAGLVAASPSAVSAGDLKLSLTNGRATIVADDVPLRQILSEWARVGKTTIVNADKLVGPSVTLQLVDVPEEQALETLLRSASGYVVAQRASYVPGASVFDRIMIMPTSRPPAASASASPPTFNQPRPMRVPTGDEDDPMDPPVMMPPNMGGIQPNPNVPQMMPPNMGGAQPNPNVPQMMPAPGMPPNMQQPPLTAPRPGMLPPAPGQPGAPPVIRPPGGPGGGPGGEQ